MSRDGGKKQGNQGGDSYRPWTTREVDYLKRHAREGAQAIADTLNRTRKAVERKAEELRVSTRKPGTRGGILLGQPRGTALAELRSSARRVVQMHAIRDAALAGVLDLSRVEADVRAELAREPVEICPGCGKRPVRKTTGLCGVCHLDRQSDGLEEAAAELEARRRHDTAKQQLKRARDRLSGEIA